MPFHGCRKYKYINNRKTHSLQRRFNDKSPQTKQKGTHEKVSSCASKGSLTLEAAFILPFFFIGMLVLCGFMQILALQIKENAELSEKAKYMGQLAYAGQDLAGDGIIDLKIVRQYKFPVALVPGQSVRYLCRARVHGWVGYDPENAEEDLANGNYEMVYVTENESVYHTDASCTHLDLAIHTVSSSEVSGLRNEYGSRYHSCDKCGSNTSSGTVYITDKGDCYHTDPSCSGLKRTVRLVKKSELGNLCQCSRCAAGG